MNATEVFGAYATAFQQQPLPETIAHHAKRAVIDWYASLLAGQQVAPVPQLRDVFSREIGSGQARLVDGRTTSAQFAALINGTAAHAAEVDDSYREAMYHPGAATISAALAMAQEVGTSGTEFLKAVVLGYEVSTRIGVVLGRPHYHYWHNTGLVGVFGAAAAAAGILGLSGPEFSHALSTAATFSAGLQQAFRMDSMSKPLHAGRAAEGGVLAARLAAKGVTGSLDVLDGDVGMGNAMSDGPDWSQVGVTLGAEFHIERLTFKNHIGCGHTFAIIDATLSLLNEHQLNASDIDRVTVATYGPALAIACYDAPQSINEAKFSIPFVVATALIYGRVRFDAYTPERLADQGIHKLMTRIESTVDSALDAAFPQQRSARVEIETVGGNRYTAFQPHRKGDPELPLTDTELEDKFLELVMPEIGASTAERMLEVLWGLESVDDMRGLVP